MHLCDCGVLDPDSVRTACYTLSEPLHLIALISLHLISNRVSGIRMGDVPGFVQPAFEGHPESQLAPLAHWLKGNAPVSTLSSDAHMLRGFDH